MSNPKPHRHVPLGIEAQAIGLMIAAVRKAQGKRNPNDFLVGTPEFEAAGAEFVQDLLKFLKRAGNKPTTF